MKLIQQGILGALLAFALPASAIAAEPAATQRMLVIHAGAGVVSDDMEPAAQQAIRAKLAEALTAGYARLAAGKPAINTITAAITLLEDDSKYNGGMQP